MKYSPMQITDPSIEADISIGQSLFGKVAEVYRRSRNVIFEIYVMLTVAMAVLACFLYCFVQL